MATTTSKAIRDRIITVVSGLTPAVHAELPFVAYLDESGADFRRWSLAHPLLCTRRVQVRVTSVGEPPDALNADAWVAELATFDIVIAYSQRWRAGQAFDRDNTMESDLRLITDAIGVRGSANFTPATGADATWRAHLDAQGQFERGSGLDGVDFVAIRQQMSYLRAA